MCDRLCILNCPFCCENFGGEKCALEVVQHFVKKKLCKIADDQGYCCPLRNREECKMTKEECEKALKSIALNYDGNGDDSHA